MNLYKILPICSLLFIACSDENPDSIFNAESENLTSSSWIASSSSNSRNDVSSSSSIRNDVNSSSSIVALSSSVILAASSSSATVAESSSSDMLADPTKLFDTRVPNQEALFCMDSTAYTVFKRC